MSEPNPNPDAANGRGPARALGARTTRGFAWLIMQTFGNQFVRFAGLLVLARLLSEDDFGLVAVALAVNAFAKVFENAGLRDVLIQRHRHFRRWCNAAFWLSLPLGALATLIIVGAGLVAPVLYDPAVAPLIFIVAFAAPFRAVTIVAQAKVHSAMHFKLNAIIEVGQTVILMGLSILFALLGWGAASYVLPLPIAAAWRAGMYWWVARPPIKSDPQFRRWKYLIGDSGRLIAANLAQWTQGFAEYLILGALHVASVTGLYFFAFSLFRQPSRLLSGNLRLVLVPSFSKLQDEPQRLRDGFLRACRLLAYVGAPCGFGLVATAHPIFRMLFEAKWEPAIPMFQIMSCGLGITLLAGPSRSALIGQGRFQTMLVLALTLSVAQVIAVAIVATLTRDQGNAGAVAVAATVISCASVFTPIRAYIAIRPLGGTWLDVVGIIARPLVLAALAVAPAWWLGSQFESNSLQLATTITLSVSAYVVLMFMFARDDAQEIVTRTRQLARRKRTPRTRPGNAETGES